MGKISATFAREHVPLLELSHAFKVEPHLPTSHLSSRTPSTNIETKTHEVSLAQYRFQCSYYGTRSASAKLAYAKTFLTTEVHTSINACQHERYNMEKS